MAWLSENRYFLDRWTGRLAALLLLSAVLLPGPVRANTPGKIKAGILANFPPFFYLNQKTGQPEGFAVEVMDKIAERAGYLVSYEVFATWAELNAAMDAQQIDLIPNDGITPEREKNYLFTVPYQTFPISIFVRSSSREISGLVSLEGRSVAVVETNIGYKIMKSFGKAILNVYPSPEEALMSLLSGVSDAVLYPRPPFEGIAINTGLSERIKATGEPVMEVKRGIAVVRTKPRLRDDLNDQVTMFIETREFSRLNSKWFHSPLPYWNVRRIAFVMVGLLLLVTSVLLGWRYRSVLNVSRELAKSEERYRKLIAEMDIGFALHEIVTDESGTIVDLRFLEVNPTFLMWFEQGYEDIAGKTTREIGLQFDDDVIRKLGLVALTGESSRFEMFLEKSGKYFDVLAYSRQKEQVVILLSDITEQKEARNREEQYQKQLLQSQKMEALGTLAGGIAHDFNNLLMAIMGYADIARLKARGQPELESNLDQVIRAGERARDLVSQILSFSRQSDTEIRPIEVNILVKEALKLLRSTVPTSITISTDVTRQPCVVLGNPTQIHQVIMNLCTNAIHSMDKKGGVLEVSLAKVTVDVGGVPEDAAAGPGRFVKLTVRDNGEGIEKSVMEKIFEPYFTTKGKDKGTGLGLFIVHGIVRDAGGWIDVESKPGKETAFGVFLPSQEPDDTAGHHAPLTGAPVPGEERVLIVDDELQLGQMLGEILGRLGYRVEVYSDSLAALAQFNKRFDEFDAVITDMSMPGMDGAALTLRVRERRKDIPIILLTGFSEHVTTENAAKMGIDKFIMKPVLVGEISSVLREALDKGKRENG